MLDEPSHTVLWLVVYVQCVSEDDQQRWGLSFHYAGPRHQIHQAWRPVLLPESQPHTLYSVRLLSTRGHLSVPRFWQLAATCLGTPAGPSPHFHPVGDTFQFLVSKVLALRAWGPKSESGIAMRICNPAQKRQRSEFPGQPALLASW